MKKSEFYSDYQKARDKSWEIIFKYKINSLPVDLFRLAKQLKIKIISYDKGKSLIKTMGLEDHKSNDAFTAVIKKRYIIFYNDTVENQGRLRFTLAHELGHIVLGHVKTATVWNRGEDEPQSPEEIQANIFASRLLAPACVLHELNLHTHEDIAELCGLSYAAAKIRAERMETLYEREKEWLQKYGISCFGISEREQKALKQFDKFINNKKHDSLNKHKR